MSQFPFPVKNGNTIQDRSDNKSSVGCDASPVNLILGKIRSVVFQLGCGQPAVADKQAVVCRSHQ